jgi:hypothetical protein
MRFETDDKKINLEDTGYIKVHNYPSNGKTFSYITRIYRQYEQGVFGWKEIDGEPIYFHDLTQEQLVLAIIVGNAQNVLSLKLPREGFLKPVKKGR